MLARRMTVGTIAALIVLLGLGQERSIGQQKKVWTDANDSTLPIDFKFQGEYVGQFMPDGPKVGCQVIALDKGQFQAVLLPGGLPGDGWDGKSKILMHGRLDNDKVTFEPAAGKRRYLAQNPEEFSATAKYPPEGQIDARATIVDGTMTGSTKEKDFKLTKTQRKSPTMGRKASSSAVILFDGTGTSEWKGGRLDKTTGLLNTDGSDIVSKKKFNNYTAHVEFMLPYRPEGRGQGRGNSGFYQVHHYEVQILDSFGLDGKHDECGGIYSRVAPKLNMCLPPLVWQTYDVDFTNAVRSEDGKKVVKKARATIKLNGVVIHDDQEIAGPTGGSRGDPEGTPGPILLQGHGNPLQFRHIWIAEKQ